MKRNRRFCSLHLSTNQLRDETYIGVDEHSQWFSSANTKRKPPVEVGGFSKVLDLNFCYFVFSGKNERKRKEKRTVWRTIVIRNAGQPILHILLIHLTLDHFHFLLLKIDSNVLQSCYCCYCCYRCCCWGRFVNRRTVLVNWDPKLCITESGGCVCMYWVMGKWDTRGPILSHGKYSERGWSSQNKICPDTNCQAVS